MSLKRAAFFCLMIFTSTISRQVYAQKDALSDLAKIELITKGAWIDGYYQRVEVVPENGVWKSYQRRLINQGYSRGRRLVNDSSRSFIREVPASVIKQFITLTTTPDPIIRDELFKLKTADLITQIDSLLAEEERFNSYQLFPSAEWKSQFMKAVSTKSVVSKALYNVLHPLPMDDRSHYYIITTDKFNKTDTVTTDANNELYYLPWTMSGKQSYNPDITKLFELIRGNSSFADKEQKRLNHQVIAEIYYYKTFKAQLDWDRFKAEQPEIYNKVSKTLMPSKFSHYNDGSNTADMGYNGVFLSTQLPGYIELSCYFAKDHPASVDFQNAFETRLAAWYKKGNFLFDFMKRHPNATMYFSPSIQDELYTAIEKRYQALAKIDREKIRVFSIAGNKEYPNSSLWLLLPDDKLILMKYGGTLAHNYQNKFDIIPAKKRGLRFTNVCVVFNKYGKKIGGSEEPFEVKRKEL